jgi:hypothetical protein
VHVEHECAHLPYRRAWLGWTGRERVDGIDGGQFVEFIPIEVFPKAVRESVGQPLSGPIPSLRVARRISLVRSLDAAVSQLSELVGLGEPGPFDDDLLGVRGARWSFLHPGGAELVVAEAHGAGPAADHLAEAGPGTWLTTIDCTDPAALAESCVACGATQAALGDGRIHLTDPDTGIRLELRTAAG